MKKIFFLFGLTSTLNAFMVRVGSKTIAINNLFLFCLIAVILIRGKIFAKKNNQIIKWLMFAVILLISSFIAVLSNNSLAYDSISISVKYALIIVLFLFFMNDEQIKDNAEGFYTGLYWSIIIQMIWAYAQYGLHFLNINLNDVVFNQIMKVNANPFSQLASWGYAYRATGLSWEPANLAICMCFGYYMTDKIQIKIGMLIALLLSGSRAGIVAFATSLLITTLYNLLQQNKKTRAKIFKWIVLVVGLCILMVILIKKTNYGDVVTSNIRRMSAVLNGGDSSSSRHLEYYIRMPEYLDKVDTISEFFGCGTFISGQNISRYLNIYTYLTDTTWNPESDLVTILVGNGIIGVILYLSILLSSFIYNFRKKRICNSQMIFVILISGILYLYLRSTWILVLELFLTLVKSDLKQYSNIKGKQVYNER
ncbi:MAG: O-antigen ligase family protein [Lachnospiraceae bacterium]|nr:O-antigen ligase family protein [Lachnospiraceae bacterium]